LELDFVKALSKAKSLSKQKLETEQPLFSRGNIQLIAIVVVVVVNV